MGAKRDHTTGDTNTLRLCTSSTMENSVDDVVYFTHRNCASDRGIIFMTLTWLAIWILSHTPQIIFSPVWNEWAVALIICVGLDIFGTKWVVIYEKD